VSYASSEKILNYIDRNGEGNIDFNQLTKNLDIFESKIEESLLVQDHKPGS
jgi:Ca2+-binding EF-hand superfamily protein